MPRSVKRSHWAIIDKATGEHHFAIGEGRNRPGGYDPAAVRFVRLKRAPCEHDHFDGKALRECRETRRQIDETASLDRMTRAEFVAHVLKLVDDRLAQASPLTPETET